MGCIQTHGSLANWHPHIHLIATDGGFRPDGAFVSWPAHDTVLVPDGDTAFALRLARYCARNPVALERLAYDPAARQVRYRSDKGDGPTAGTETVDPLEFLARVTAHIPNKYQVMTRYYGYYANRVRGARRRRAVAPDGLPPAAKPVAEPGPLALREARHRWAELLRQIFEVDPLRCPDCRAGMRIVAFITQAAVIASILDHLRRSRGAARGPPSTGPPSTRRPARTRAERQRT